MLRVTLGAKVLCGAAALLQVACGITPDWTSRKRAAAECPLDYMHYCRHSN